jgi:hypothetical protein
MNEREQRVGLNEAVFRQVNEEIRNLASRFDLADRELDLICECGDSSCVERISMAAREYEAMRSEPTYFAVYPGHEETDVERVISKAKGYDVVEKDAGEPSELARETNPRA